MEKNTIKLNETDLKNIIKEAVKNVLNEGTTIDTDQIKWDKLQEQLGSETMINELYNYLNEDQIADFIICIEKEYDLNYDEEYQEYFNNY